MSCSRVGRRLSAFLEGDVSEREGRRLSRHLSDCSACQADLERLRRTVGALRTFSPVDAPAGLAERVAERVAAGEGRSPFGAAGRWLERTMAAPWLAPVAAAALGMLVFTWVQDLDDRVTAGLGLRAATSPGVPRETGIAGPSPLPSATREAALARAEAPRVAAATGAPRPSMAACIAGGPDGAPADPQACAAWYAWFVGLALDDAPGFLDEVEQLPVAQRDPWLRHVSQFAARSGSAALVGRQLRSSRDPRAVPVANRFERSVGFPIRSAGYTGR